METLSAGLIALFNGAYTVVSGLVSPWALTIGMTAVGLGWFAVLELDELEREGRKPTSERH